MKPYEVIKAFRNIPAKFIDEKTNWALWGDENNLILIIMHPEHAPMYWNLSIQNWKVMEVK